MSFLVTTIEKIITKKVSGSFILYPGTSKITYKFFHKISKICS